MALTRGPKSDFPCPICLIPRERLKYATEAGRQRRNRDALEILIKDQTMTAREAELKAKGLKNAAVSIKFSHSSCKFR